MNKEQETIQNRLRTKIETLVSAHQQLLDENATLKEHSTGLKQQLQEKEEAYIELEQKYNQQQLAKAFVASSEEHAHDAKIRVNRIVREIDHCIALLNK